MAWRLDNSHVDGRLADPCGGQRLTNGNTVICSYGQKKGDMPKILKLPKIRKSYGNILILKFVLTKCM